MCSLDSLLFNRIVCELVVWAIGIEAVDESVRGDVVVVVVLRGPYDSTNGVLLVGRLHMFWLRLGLAGSSSRVYDGLGQKMCGVVLDALSFIRQVHILQGVYGSYVI